MRIFEYLYPGNWFRRSADTTVQEQGRKASRPIELPHPELKYLKSGGASSAQLEQFQIGFECLDVNKADLINAYSILIQEEQTEPGHIAVFNQVVRAIKDSEGFDVINLAHTFADKIKDGFSCVDLYQIYAPINTPGGFDAGVI